MAPLTVEMRPLSLDDVEAMAALERAHQPVPWSEQVIREELEGPGRTYLGIFAGPHLVGYGGVMVFGEEAHLTNLLVEREERRRGLGKALMVGLIEAAIEAGACHLTLEVRAHNNAAIGLYRRFGLGPVGVRDGYYGDDDALILWVHDIDSEEYRERLRSLGGTS